MTRREFGAIAAGAMLLGERAAAQQGGAAILDIADWSYFWYGVEHATLARGTVCNGMQIYVEWWIPRVVRHPYPVVLIHDAYGGGSDFFSTLDGKPGWVSLLAAEGYKVYVVDRPGQGRCPHHPWVHGQYDRQARTYQDAAMQLGAAGAARPNEVEQLVASMRQPMRGSITQQVWASRGVMLLEDIGPSIFVTRGDGVGFARAVANARPELVKGIVEGASNDLAPILRRLDEIAAPTAPVPGLDPNRNRESTALRLADQGGFWIVPQKKQMPYGEIPVGQMFVQYMIPAERKHALPIVMVHGGGGQGTHMMGLGRRPGWVHYFVQAGYAVYWVDRASYGRSPYHPDALGPGHLPNVPAYEGLMETPNVFKTGQWPGVGGMNDPFIDQFMACERGNISDEPLHSELMWTAGAMLLDKIGPAILFTHAFGGFFGWGVADRRPNLVKAIACMEINGNPFVPQLTWGLTAGPMTFDPPVASPADFRLVDTPMPADSPRPAPAMFRLQAEPARKWKNLQNIPMSWMTSEYGAGGPPMAHVEFLKQVGCNVELLRLRDHGIHGNGNLMLMEKNNHEVFGVLNEWIEKTLPQG